jgi:transposase
MPYPYALGIDLHKRQSTWKLVDAQHAVIWSKTVLCQPVNLLSALRQLPVPTTNLPIALEPTCGWRWVSQLLAEQGGDVHITNPYKLRLIADSRQKTDDEDAKTLAEFLQLGYLPESWRAPNEVEVWRQLVRVRVSLVEARTRVKNQITSLLTAAGPLVTKQALPADLKFRELTALIREQTAHIQVLEKEIERVVAKEAVCQLLKSVPGVGRLTALTILAEVGDFSRFPTADQLASFAGLVPAQRSSGQTVRYGHLTKTGSQLLRTTLVETAMRFRPYHDDRLWSWFLQVRDKRGAMRARVALGRKLLSIMWSLVKKQQPFVSSPGTVKSGDLV